MRNTWLIMKFAIASATKTTLAEGVPTGRSSDQGPRHCPCRRETSDRARGQMQTALLNARLAHSYSAPCPCRLTRSSDRLSPARTVTSRMSIMIAPPVVPRQINHIRDVPPCGPITPPIGTSLSGSSNPPPTARRRKRDPSPVARPDQPAKELPSRTCAKVQKSSGSTPISRTIAPSAPHLFADRRPDENGANRLCDHAKSRRNPDQTPCVAIDHLT